MATCSWASRVISAAVVTFFCGAVAAQTPPKPHPMPPVRESGHKAYASTEPKAVLLPNSWLPLKGIVGKLTFDVPIPYNNPEKHYCTAQVVDQNVILTAAHCAMVGFHNMSFVLDDGSAGPVSIMCVARNSNWKDPRSANVDPFINVRFDYVFLKTSSAISPPKVFSINWQNSRNSRLSGIQITSVGYPAAEPMLGLWSLVNTDVLFDILHPLINSIATNDNNYTSGVSGGGWISQDDKGNFSLQSLNSSYASALNDGGYITIYGPILDLDAQNLEKFALVATVADGNMSCLQ